MCVCIDTDELRSSIPVGIDSTSKAVGLEEEAETTAKEDKAARSVRRMTVDAIEAGRITDGSIGVTRIRRHAWQVRPRDLHALATPVLRRRQVSSLKPLKLIHRRQLVKKDTADIVQSLLRFVHRSVFGRESSNSILARRDFAWRPWTPPGGRTMAMARS